MKKFLMFLTLVWSGCEEVIDLKTPQDFQGTLFVEGLLITGQPPRIYLSEALPFFQTDVTPQQVFARNAELVLSDSQGPELLTADSVFDYFRCRWEPFYRGEKQILAGEEYHLVINYKGQTYTASTTIDQEKPTIESVVYIPEFYDVYGGHDGVNIFLSDPEGTGNFYRFQMNRKIDNSVAHAHELDVITSTCTSGEKFWVTDLGRTIFSDEGLDGTTLDMLIEVSFEYSQGDSAWITMQSLDPQAAAFYKELDDQLISILNPFVEPVFLESRIGGDAVGFLGSVVLSDSVLFVYPQDNP